MTANDYRKRAEECEKLAKTPGYENQRALLLDIAAKWRFLARQTEADEKSRDKSDRP